MFVQWYLLKTWAGMEEELVKEIRRRIPSNVYQECFVIYQERVWRKQQRSIVHRELLFPGCVFLIGEPANEREINYFVTEWFSWHSELHLLPMMRKDIQFLERISGKEHLVKLAYVQKDEEGNIHALSEPLNGCRGQIERFQLKKRYAMVRCPLWGEEQVLVLGIMLKEDENRMFWADDVKIPVKEMA